MGPGMYPTPEDWADAVLKRLAHEGFAVVPVAPDLQCGLTDRATVMQGEWDRLKADGLRAGQDGAAADTCPYNEVSPEAAAWLDGWCKS